MTNIVCDICKKVIPDSTRNYSWETRYARYDTIKDKDLCPDCLGDLNDEIGGVMENHSKYGFETYKSTLSKKLEELTD